MFRLDARLQRDTVAIASLPLSELLLMNDSQYPWLILVPRRSDVRELVELDAGDQLQLLRESNAIARILLDKFAAAKINIAALGNIVPQLHLHHIARYPDDTAWPAPVWGVSEPVAYDDIALQRCKQLLEEGLGNSQAQWQL